MKPTREEFTSIVVSILQGLLASGQYSLPNFPSSDQHEAQEDALNDAIRLAHMTINESAAYYYRLGS